MNKIIMVILGMTCFFQCLTVNAVNTEILESPTEKNLSIDSSVLDTKQSDETNIVTVVGRKSNLVGESISASEGIVGEQEIEIRPLFRTGEVLEFVPGMVVTQHSGNGKANQYFLRGFNLDHGTDFATFVDDMPVNKRTHGHGQGYTDLNFIIPELINNITYKKGTYYAEIGDFSGVGSAKMQTANKLDKGMIDLTLGSENYFRMVAADSVELNSGEWLYALEHNTSDGHWSDINEDINKTNVLIKNEQDLAGGDFSIGLMLYDNVWNSADQIPQRAVETGLIDEFGSIDKTVGGESNRYSLSANWQNNSWQLAAFAIRYNLNLWSNFTYFLQDPVNGDQFEQVDQRWIYGINTAYQTSDVLAGREISNRFGVQYQFEQIEEVGLYKTQFRNRLGTIKRDQVDEHSLGIYWQNELELSDNLRSTLGVRYDYYLFDVTSLVAQNYYNVDLSGNSGDSNDNLFSAKTSLIYTASDNIEIYASFGQGFHSNDARGTTIKKEPLSGTAIEQVDPLVRSTGGEFGLRAFQEKKFNASIVFWYLNLESELIFVGDAGVTEPSGESARHGFELTTYYHFDDNWTADIELAQTDAKYVDESSFANKIPGAIDRVIQLGISADYEQGYFGSLRLRYFGERPLNEESSVTSDSSHVINLRAGHRWDNWNLKADLINLLDSRDSDIDYFYESQLASESQPVEDFHFHPFEPRTYRVTLSYRF